MRAFLMKLQISWGLVYLCLAGQLLADGPVLNGTRYAPTPSDPYYYVQWPLENRFADGSSAGPDLNVRAAWPYARGEGITVAVVDLGLDGRHPDLAPRLIGAPHFNFDTLSTNAGPVNRNASSAHGTEMAGLISAEEGNRKGMVGVAPRARLASWVIYNTNLTRLDPTRLAAMYSYESNRVDVQNHSWGSSALTLQPIPAAEDAAIAEAVQNGRQGRGVIMVRSAGNNRVAGGNVNDDGYAADPRVITVASLRTDGRVATYSEPGAPILVAAPSGDSGFPLLFTTDLVGTDGANAFQFFPPNQELNDYVFDSLGFTGTSASAALISGAAALVLSANPRLGYRDVQQILLLASRHYDLADPDLTTNAVGKLVSHNLGYGVPDLGFAVQLALSWSNRPPATTLILRNSTGAQVPDGGYRLVLTGSNIPPALTNISGLPSFGMHPDIATGTYLLVDIGTAATNFTASLAGKAALIQRGGVDYEQKLARAAAAGASLAVIYNNATGNSGCPGGDALCPMGGTDFSTIPAIFVGQTAGDALRNLVVQSSNVLAQLRLDATNYTFNVTNGLSCEFVGVQVMSDHPLRGDLRITLVSPQGTRSVLQRFNADTSAGPVDWVYWSAHHFFESSRGPWRVEISDEVPDNVGPIRGVSLILQGVAMEDADADGLDDRWELGHFGNLDRGPRDDSDRDGMRNFLEQILGTNPTEESRGLALTLGRWKNGLGRIAWPATTNHQYQLLSGSAVDSLTVVTNLPGRFPVAEVFTAVTNLSGFFQVRRVTP